MLIFPLFLLVYAVSVTMSKLKALWNKYKVLIVMGTSLGLIHWGWYAAKSNPLLRQGRQDFVPEPGIVAFVSPPTAPPPAEPAAKGK